MELSDLKVFRAVVEAGGITRAAERLHRVPSNITTRIRQLEEDLGLVLFFRDGKRLRLSPAGHLLFDYASRILGLAQEAREALHGTTPHGRLRLGTMESTAASRLPAPLAEYHRRFPEVALELRTGSTKQLMMWVLNGELEAALVADPAADARLDELTLFEEKLVIVAEAGHAAIRSPNDVSGRTLLAFGEGCAYRKRLEQWFSDADMVPEKLTELSSYHAMLGCVAAGMGIALMPRSVLKILPEHVHVSVHELPRAHRRSKTSLVRRKGVKTARLDVLSEILLATRG